MLKCYWCHLNADDSVLYTSASSSGSETIIFQTFYVTRRSLSTCKQVLHANKTKQCGSCGQKLTHKQLMLCLPSTYSGLPTLNSYKDTSDSRMMEPEEGPGVTLSLKNIGIFPGSIKGRAYVIRSAVWGLCNIRNIKLSTSNQSCVKCKNVVNVVFKNHLYGKKFDIYTEYHHSGKKYWDILVHITQPQPEVPRCWIMLEF